MRYLVFESDQFKEDLAHHGLYKQYELFKEKVERGEVTFESIEGLKKTTKLEWNLRLVAWDGTLELFNKDMDPRLLVFLHIFAKRDREYSQFTNKMDKKGKCEIRDKLIKPLTSQYKESLIKAYHNHQKPPAFNRPSLMEEPLPWIELNTWYDKAGNFINLCCY